MKRSGLAMVALVSVGAVFVACGGSDATPPPIGDDSSDAGHGGSSGAKSGGSVAGGTAGSGGAKSGGAGANAGGTSGAGASGAPAGGSAGSVSGGAPAGGSSGAPAGGSSGAPAGGTGGTEAGGTDAGGMDAGGTDAGGTDAGGSDVGGSAGTDAGGSAGADAGGADAGGSAGAGGCNDGDQCTTATGSSICGSGACGCAETTAGDTACITAYGTDHVCSAGDCIVGDCRTTADCGGQICGIATANECGPCAKDNDCKAPGAAGPACDTKTGLCGVSNAACKGVTDGRAPTGDPKDVCCDEKVTPGNCCTGAAGDAACVVELGVGAECVANTCVTCDAVGSSQVYLVDPSAGDDTRATGSGTAANTASDSCAFKTIKKALAAIAAAKLGAGVAATISVRATATVADGETFPITLPANVSLVAANPKKPVTIEPPAAAAGAEAIHLNAAGTNVSGFVLDGTKAAATMLQGILVDGGDATTTIDHVTVQQFTKGHSIVASGGGVLTIGGGVVTTQTQAAADNFAGLHVLGAASVTITAPAGTDQVKFANRSFGILVDGAGSITATGDVATATIVAEANEVAGVRVESTPPVAPAKLAASSLTGVLAENGVLSGFEFYTGSIVSLRLSKAAENGGNGVYIRPGKGTLTAAGGIDLGHSGAPGGNHFQFTAAEGGANSLVGLCVLVPLSTTNQLNAIGNVFAGDNDCVTPANALSTTAGDTCTSGRDIGFTVASKAFINVDNCTIK